MKQFSRLLLLSYVLYGCTLIGYEELTADSGRDASRPNEGGTISEDATFDAAKTEDAAADAAEPESGLWDGAVDAEPIKDGAPFDAQQGKDSALPDAEHVKDAALPDAEHIKDAAFPDAGKHDAAPEDTGL